MGEVAIILDVVSDSDVVILSKVTLTKNFSINTSSIQPWTPDSNTSYERKQSNGTRNMRNINFVTKDVQRILSSHKKISKKYNEQKVFYTKTVLNNLTKSTN